MGIVANRLSNETHASLYPNMEQAAAVQESVEQLITKYDRLIRHLAFRFAQSGVSVDDLVQEGRIAVWRSRETLARTGRGESSFWTYARKAVFAAMLRRVNDQSLVHSDEPDSELEDEQNTTEKMETRLFIRECLQRLPTEERRVVQFYLGGDSVDSIAALTGHANRHVRYLLTLATDRLRKDLEACL